MKLIVLVSKTGAMPGTNETMLWWPCHIVTWCHQWWLIVAKLAEFDNIMRESVSGDN